MPWRACAVVAVLLGLFGTGCGSSNNTPGTVLPITSGVELTPEGTPGLVEVGSTGVQVRVPAGAIAVPQTFLISALVGPGDLIAPLPAGRKFVGGLNFVGTAVSADALIDFRVPARQTLNAGTPLQVFLADPRLAVPVFLPVVDRNGDPVFTEIATDGRIPLSTNLMGQFLFASVP